MGLGNYTYFANNGFTARKNPKIELKGRKRMDLLANVWNEWVAHTIAFSVASYRGFYLHWMSQMGSWTQTDLIIWGAAALVFVRSAFTINRAL